MLEFSRASALTGFFMVSDIKGLESRQTGGARTADVGRPRSDAPDRAERGADAAARDDTVELSGLAEVVTTAARKLAAEPAVDRSRVEDIRKALASGTYVVDPASIARKQFPSPIPPKPVSCGICWAPPPKCSPARKA